MGKIEDADAIGEAGNPVCGDMLRIYLKVKDGKIEDIKVETLGCAAAIAMASLITEKAKGKTLEEAEKITSKDVIDSLGKVPPVKYHCGGLAEQALKNAIKNYREKHGNKISN